MKKLINHLRNDSFLKTNFIFLVGSLIVSALNYAYHPIMGHLLSLQDFGELEAINSLFAQLTIVTGVFGIIVINTVSNQKDKEKTKYIITELQRVALIITFLFFGVIVLFSRQLQYTLQFKSALPFLVLALLLPLATTLGFRSSYLQGERKFKEVSFINVLSSSMKLLFAIILVYIGFRTAGAIAAIIVAQVIAIFYAFRKTKDSLPIMSKIPFLPTKDRQNETVEIKEELKYGFFIFCMLYSITFLYTADILVVKKFFDPVTAGLYGGVSTISGIIFFVTSSVAGVLLPSIKIDDVEKKNHNILLKSVLIVVGLSLPAFLAFYFFPAPIIHVLLGNKFTAYAPMLSFLAISIIITSVVNLFVYYFIAVRRYFSAIFPVTGLALFLLLSGMNHAKVTSIISNLIISNLTVLVLLVSYYFLQERRIYEK